MNVLLLFLLPVVISGLSYHEIKSASDFMWIPTDDGGLAPAYMAYDPAGEVLSPEDKVHFYLLTKANPTTDLADKLIPYNDESLSKSHYLRQAPLKIISHGFNSQWDGLLGQVMKDAFLSLPEDVNVVLVDWNRLCRAPWYGSAVSNTKVAAKKTADLINFLISKGALTRDQVHILGHSLGAHVAGFVKYGMESGRPARISSLDPALPLFGNKPDDERIDPSDADFVDVIHTAAGTLLHGGLAFSEPRGHVDFYPNSGEPSMPGCKEEGDLFGSCSHSRSYLYYAESITNKTGFSSCKCEDWEEFEKGTCPCVETAVMGYAVPLGSSGSYYLRTHPAEPYSFF